MPSTGIPCSSRLAPKATSSTSVENLALNMSSSFTCILFLHSLFRALLLFDAHCSNTFISKNVRTAQNSYTVELTDALNGIHHLPSNGLWFSLSLDVIDYCTEEPFTCWTLSLCRVQAQHNLSSTFVPCLSSLQTPEKPVNVKPATMPLQTFRERIYRSTCPDNVFRTYSALERNKLNPITSPEASLSSASSSILFFSQSPQSPSAVTHTLTLHPTRS